METKTESPQRQAASLVNLALSLVGQVGCLTILILLAAAFIGRWLDARYETGRNFTLWFILGSVPITLFLMYALVRLTMKRVSSKESISSNNQAMPAHLKEEE